MEEISKIEQARNLIKSSRETTAALVEDLAKHSNIVIDLTKICREIETRGSPQQVERLSTLRADMRGILMDLYQSAVEGKGLDLSGENIALTKIFRQSQPTMNPTWATFTVRKYLYDLHNNK